jgi:magnesium-transporting ATPase (P-type)
VSSIKNLLLRGCYLRNIDCCYGIVIYVGDESKIMKNSKKVPKKISNIMIKMNHMLYTVFAFQFALILAFASLQLHW